MHEAFIVGSSAGEVTCAAFFCVRGRLIFGTLKMPLSIGTLQATASRYTSWIVRREVLVLGGLCSSLLQLSMFRS